MTTPQPAGGVVSKLLSASVDNLVRERHTREQAAKHFTLAGSWWKMPTLPRISWPSAECFFRGWGSIVRHQEDRLVKTSCVYSMGQCILHRPGTSYYRRFVVRPFAGPSPQRLPNRRRRFSRVTTG